MHNTIGHYFPICRHNKYMLIFLKQIGLTCCRTMLIYPLTLSNPGFTHNLHSEAFPPSGRMKTCRGNACLDKDNHIGTKVPDSSDPNHQVA